MNGFNHLSNTFAENERMFPDLMEPYSIMLSDRDLPADERVAIMQRGLRETICARYPMAEVREAAGSAQPDTQGDLAL